MMSIFHFKKKFPENIDFCQVSTNSIKNLMRIKEIKKFFNESFENKDSENLTISEIE